MRATTTPAWASEAFVPVDPSREIELAAIEDTPYYAQITLRNAAPRGGTCERLQAFFGGERVSVESVFGSQDCVVKVPGIAVPTSYRFLDVLPAVEKLVGDDRLFLGIGPFGPVTMRLADFTHTAIIGPTGSGKSQAMKSLLTQAATHPQIVCHVIDPKRVDFTGLADLPGMGYVATSREQWIGLFAALLIETSYRETVFSQAFTTPPTSLAEYKKLRESHGRDDLPDFPYMMVWCDEARAVFETNHHDEVAADLARYLVRRTRAFGIHLIFGTQRELDSGSLIVSQCNNILRFQAFEEGFTYRTVKAKDLQRTLPAMPGRCVADLGRTEVAEEIQAPMISANEMLAVVYASGRPAVPAGYGFHRLPIHMMGLTPAELASALFAGISLPSALAQAVKDKERRGQPWFRLKLACPDFLAQIHGGGSGEETSNLENGEPLAFVPSDLISFETTCNTPSREEALGDLERARAKAKGDFLWCTKNLSANPGLQRIYEDLQGSSSDDAAPITLSDLALPAVLVARLSRFVSSAREQVASGRRSEMLLLLGAAGQGKSAVARAIAGELGGTWRLATAAERASRLGRDGKPSRKTGGQAPPPNDPPCTKAPPVVVIFREVEAARAHFHASPSNELTALLGEDEERYSFFGDDATVSFDASPVVEPSCTVRLGESFWRDRELLEQLVASLLRQRGLGGALGSEKWASLFLSSSLCLSPSTVDRVLAKAVARAGLEERLVARADVAESLLELAAARSAAPSGVKIRRPERGMKDLHIEDGVRRRLREAIQKVKSREGVDYRFLERAGGRPSRMVALFHGSPGTGKTLAAEVLAHETGRDLWICDFSQLVNKYVGETEKAIAKTFAAAEAGRVVLLLDECDALLGSRETASASYERRWVNSLLVQVEAFAGVLVMTTNFPAVLDSALARRCDAIVEFPMPNEALLAVMLEDALKPDAPVAPDLDYRALVRDLRLSGSSLANAVNRAAVTMLTEGRSSMSAEDLRRALVDAEAEYGAKTGKHGSIGFGRADL